VARPGVTTVGTAVGVAVAVAAALIAFASPAAAHGVGGRSDLPLPLWQFLYAAGAALVVSFLALRLLWPRARLTAASEGVALPRPVDTVVSVLGVAVRVLGVVLWAVTIAAAWGGTENSRENLAPTLVYVALWVGMQATSAVLGDVWRALSPFDTIALVVGWARTTFAPRSRRDDRDPDPAQDLSRSAGGASGPAGTSHRQYGSGDGSLVWSHWPAVLGVLGFTWLELCYHSPDEPRVLAVVMTGYSIVVLAGAARWGREWLRTGETFAVLFGMLALLSPFFRDDGGRLRVRVPFTGLATMRARPGTVAFVCVLLGSTGFDGVEGTQWWQDVLGTKRGWERTFVDTIGLVWVIALVFAVYVVAAWGAAWLGGADRGGAPQRFVPSLVPIALAYAIAHYFSLFVIEMQAFHELLSDPFGHGWDLFGVGPADVNLAIVSTGTIAWVQVASIVVGHVVGVVVAHDIAVEDMPVQRAVRSQYAMLAVMIAYTVGGLALLLGA
jgi:hypothetical protein